MKLRDEKNIYTYYKDFSGDLIDCVYGAVPFTIRKIFSKKWGNYLKGNSGVIFTESEKLLFQKSALQFEKYLLIAKELKQKGCTFHQIKNFFIHNFGLPFNYQNSNVKLYRDVDHLLQAYEVTVAEINVILNTLPKIQKFCFIGYYKKKLDIYKIAEKLKCSIDEVIGCLNAVNRALEAYQTGKLLENPDLSAIENITIPISEESQQNIVSTEKATSSENHKKINTVSSNLEKMNGKFDSTNIPKIYSGKEEFLNQYNMTEDQLQEILNDFSTNLKIAVTYLNGIDRPKFSVEQVANILKCDTKTVYDNLSLAYKRIEKNQQLLESEDPNEYDLKEKKRIKQCGPKRKTSMFEYCKPEDKPYGIMQIEWWKDHNKKLYDVIVKLYGSTYDKLDETVKLTKEEQKMWGNVITNFRIGIETRKKESQNIKVRKGPKKKSSMFEYCKPEDKPYGIMQIEWWKDHNKKLYDVIVKLYGSTYDKLDETVKLTKEEQKMWGNVITNFRIGIETRKKESQNIKVRKGPKKKSSMFDYCKPEDKEYAIKQIEWWKNYNRKYYNLIVKLYGSTYDKLNETVQLTKDEQKVWNKKIVTRFEKRIETRKKESQNIKVRKGSKKKSSMFDYCKPEDKEYAIKQIEWWKNYNRKYYNLIVKLYGPTYDKLNETVQLAKDEQNVWKNIVTGFEKGIESRKMEEQFNVKLKRGRNRKSSMFDYCKPEDKEYAIKQIEWWKDYNKKYYDVIVKLYGTIYDKLDETVKLTEEEQIIWNLITIEFKRCIESRKKEEQLNVKFKYGGNRKSSMFDYCKSEDKEYAIKQIEWWYSHNKKYYDVIVKLYGTTYDKLNENAKLTKDEQKIWSNVIASFRIGIKTRKKESQNIKIGLKRKASMFEYCEPEDKEYAIKQIEWWKDYNKKYYNVIVKLYGTTYDILNETVQLTKDEQDIWNYIIINFKKRTETRKREERPNIKIKHGKNRKASMFEYCEPEDKEYAIKQIEWWKNNNKKYYDVIIKLYGPTYDKLNEDAKLTKEEQKMWSNVVTRFEKRIETRRKKSQNIKIQNGTKKKSSMFDYCKPEDKPYGIMQIEWWHNHNKKYYDVIIKLYGPTYDKLNEDAKLTKEEHKMWSNVVTNFRIGIETRKRKSQNIKIQNGTKKKASMFDYCKLEDKPYGIMQIEWWHNHNKKYYDVIFKLYGPTYDKLNENAKLTKDEQTIWKSIVQNFEKLVEAQKIKTHSHHSSVKDNKTFDSNLDKVENGNISVLHNHEDATISSESTIPSTKKQVGLEHGQKLEKQNSEIVSVYQNRKEKILIKDIFPNEILEIEKSVYVEMQSQDFRRQKDAIAAWDRFENLCNKSIIDSKALNDMINLLYRLQKSSIALKPVDENTVAMRIKKMNSK